MFNKIKFTEEFITHIPTECLIEDIQMLRRAILPETSWDQTVSAVQCCIDCLCETIERFTNIPKGATVRPSSSSVIAPAVANGIIVHENGSDIRCVKKQPVSFAMAGGVLQCEESCPYYNNGCAPDKSGLLLEGNIEFRYDESGEDVVKQLEKKEEVKTDA